MPPDSHMTCWVVTDGKSGMENQCLGLAEALGLAPAVKRVKLRFPWRPLAPYLRAGLAHAISPAGDQLVPPWPDLLIATGRLSVPAALYIKRASPRTFAVQLQDPAVSPANFDLVVVPEHDDLRGPNVMTTRGGLHRVTPQMLHQAAENFVPQIAHLRSPRIAVLLGGSSGAYKLTPRAIARFAERLIEAATTTGGSLLITPSRRTGADNLAALKKALKGIPAYIWDGQGTNPYYGMLGLADYIVATSDSVNMVSEACATGKPVFVENLPGGSAKFNRFHKSLRNSGLTRPFDGRLERWTYRPLDEVRLVAEKVKGMMNI